MADDLDKYEGRRPSIGRNSGGAFVRGYRSRKGAPQYDPNARVDRGSIDSRSLKSDWDAAFRNTASNEFGTSGTNTAYKSTFLPDADTAPAQSLGRSPFVPTGDIMDIPTPGYSGAFDAESAASNIPGLHPLAEGESRNFDFDSIPTWDQLANGGVASHADEWSRPKAMRGWDASGKTRSKSIFDRYKTKDVAGRYDEPGTNSIGNQRDFLPRQGWGWASAFSS